MNTSLTPGPEQSPASPSEQGTPPSGRDDHTVSPRVRDYIALTVTGVWAVSLLGSLVVKDFTPSPYLLATMLGLAAAVFGSGFWRGVR